MLATVRGELFRLRREECLLWLQQWEEETYLSATMGVGRAHTINLEHMSRWFVLSRFMHGDLVLGGQKKR